VGAVVGAGVGCGVCGGSWLIWLAGGDELSPPQADSASSADKATCWDKREAGFIGNIVALLYRGLVIGQIGKRGSTANGNATSTGRTTNLIKECTPPGCGICRWIATVFFLNA
jgi:hypothetical protein